MARVAIDARLTRQMSVGMKAYTQALLDRRALLAPEIELIPCGRGENFSIAEQLLLPLEIARAKAQVVHYPTQYLPLFRPVPYVLTIHDLIHCRFAEFYEAKVAWYYRTVVAPAARGARRIIVGDDRSVEDCERYLGVDGAIVRVVPLGVERAFLEPLDAPQVDRPYLFYAGNHREHKDLPTLLAAWAALPESVGYDLVVTGADDFGDLRAGYERYGRRLLALGDIDEATLRRTYAGATALVHPALWEGFGLTMLEAMAMRTPVIACRDSVPGPLSAAAATFAPRDVPALTRAIESLRNEPELWAARVAAGRRAAEELTWDRFARRIAAVYAEVVAPE
ncbi:MAG: glycosyltransferase family 4 protein [Candidatus Baltobacteraceae bacterium]